MSDEKTKESSLCSVKCPVVFRTVLDYCDGRTPVWENATVKTLWSPDGCYSYERGKWSMVCVVLLFLPPWSYPRPSSTIVSFRNHVRSDTLTMLWHNHFHDTMKHSSNPIIDLHQSCLLQIIPPNRRNQVTRSTCPHILQFNSFPSFFPDKFTCNASLAVSDVVGRNSKLTGNRTDASLPWLLNFECLTF